MALTDIQHLEALLKETDEPMESPLYVLTVSLSQSQAALYKAPAGWTPEEWKKKFGMHWDEQDEQADQSAGWMVETLVDCAKKKRALEAAIKALGEGSAGKGAAEAHRLARDAPSGWPV